MYKVSDILGKPINAIKNVDFPVGLRKIKLNTVLSLDGLLMVVKSEDSEARFKTALLLPLLCSREQEKYIWRLERFREKFLKIQKSSFQKNMITLLQKKILRFLNF